ncbi:MAG: hypothetical protein ACJ75L_10525 [Gaiellaceae bacterium]
MSALTRRRRRTAPNTETLLDVKDKIARATSGYRDGGLRVNANRLTEPEQWELIELTREASTGGWSWERLGKGRRRLEALIEKAADARDVFADARAAAEIQALAAQAHVEAVRRPLSRKEEHGVFAELARQVEGGALGVADVGMIAALVTSFVGGRPLAPRSRIERVDGEAVLVIDAGFGPFSADLDPEGQLAGRWQETLHHVADNNGWFEVTKRGSEWSIAPGPRLRAAMDGRHVRNVPA